MLKLIGFVIQILIILVLVVFLTSNKFLISFDIGEYKYSFSSNMFVGLIILFFSFSYLIFYLFFKTRFNFQKYLQTQKLKKIEKGYSYFVQAMIAIANKDNKTAIISNKKMLNYLKNDQGLFLLLQSEIVKIEKKYDQLTSVFDLMIQKHNTK